MDLVPLVIDGTGPETLTGDIRDTLAELAAGQAPVLTKAEALRPASRR